MYHFLKEVPSQPLQEVFARLEKAYKKFFKKDAGYPKRKSFKEHRSITLTQFGMFKYKKKDGSLGTSRRMCSLTKGGKLLISKLGVIDIKWHRKLDGRVKQVVIKHQGNRWFATFCVEKHVNQGSICDANKTTGIDVGIKKFAVLSNGEEVQNPTFLRKEERKLKRAQRKDFLHKLSFRLTNSYGGICIEDLKVKNMVRNRHLAKSIHNAAINIEKAGLTQITYQPAY
ncbi:RNA-guided endonuclease InsQ/TnpB family protein [Bacillus paramycoides]|uniref:RNA-guided endonuclease InsQ/TnpB family protein n=1 Tax=Bacillus paramycoides TaxID=2026194 RepID=UPI003D021386